MNIQEFLLRNIKIATRAFSSVGAFVALVLLIVGVTIAQPHFLVYGNIMNILSQWAPVGVMGIGMTFVVIIGGFDLSVGSIYALCAVTSAAIGQSQSPVIAYVVAIAVGFVAGTLNGLIVTWLRVNPFIATLGSSLAISGVTLILTGNAAIVVNNPSFGILGANRLGGFPYSGMLMIALFVILGLILAFTPYGQSIYAVGGNADASRLAGIRTFFVTGSSYAISGLCAGIAGCVTASQLSSAQATIDPNLVFNVLTVVVLGGTVLGGGRGAVWRTAIGVGILATLHNGFNLLNINAYYQNIIQGFVIVAASASVDWSRFLIVRSANPLNVPGPEDQLFGNQDNKGE